MIRVLFMGTPEYARVILEALCSCEDIEVVGVVSQPDKPAGRKQELSVPPVKEFALKRLAHVPLFQPENLKEARLEQQWRALEPNFILVAAYGKILPRAILDIAPCINLHASILPLYRGASPIQESLRRGDEFSGVSAMLMEGGLDCGDVLAFSFVKVPKTWDSARLFEELSKQAAALGVKTLRRFSSLRAIPQIEADSSYCKKIQKCEGEVRFLHAGRVYDFYRAFKGWPGIHLASGVKLREITLISEEGTHREGEILALESDGVVVGCAQGILKIFSVQAPSKREIDALSYINGRRLVRGDTLC